MTHSKDIAGLVERAIRSDKWSAEVHDIVDAVNVASDENDFSTEQCVALGIFLAALRPAADPKAEGVVDGHELIEGLENAAERLRVMSRLREHAVGVREKHGEELDSIHNSVKVLSVALREKLRALAAHPTPDAERAGEPDAWLYRVKIDGIWRGWGATTAFDPSKMARPRFWEDVEMRRLYASQSPATEAVRVTEAVVETACHAYWVQSHIGFVCPPWESAPWEAKRLTRDNIKAALEAALIRPPVNNSPGGEHGGGGI